MKQTFSQLFCQTVFCPVPPDCLNYENMVIKHEEITPVLVCFFSLFYTKYSKKTNQSFHNKSLLFTIKQLSEEEAGMWRSEMSRYSVDLQKVIQDLQGEGN